MTQHELLELNSMLLGREGKEIKLEDHRHQEFGIFGTSPLQSNLEF